MRMRKTVYSRHMTGDDTEAESLSDVPDRRAIGVDSAEGAVIQGQVGTSEGRNPKPTDGTLNLYNRAKTGAKRPSCGLFERLCSVVVV